MQKFVLITKCVLTVVLAISAAVLAYDNNWAWPVFLLLAILSSI